MLRNIANGLFALLLAAIPAIAQDSPPKDIAGARDHPLIGRYQGSTIAIYEVKEFEEQRILTRPIVREEVQEANRERRHAKNSVAVAGRSTRITYEGPPGRSGLEIIRNFEQKLKADGFEIVFQCRAPECGPSFHISMIDDSPMGRSGLVPRPATGLYLAARLPRAEGDVWAAFYSVERASRSGQPGSAQILVDVVESRPMQTQQIVFVDASEMQKAIDSGGRVALYGIQFDFDKAELKPESRETLAEIAKYLKANASVRLIVTGHTDSQGAFDYNLDLSSRRAAAVVASLTRDFGIAASRLTPFGAGMAAPVASNADEAGRARNRRVELVRQ